MPICQPVQTSIHTGDFRDKAYCFAVESVLTPQQRIGLLTVSASPGYLLTTSLDKEPKREQSIDHSQQTDGSWIAAGKVTVAPIGDSLVNGTIIIRNSGGETVVLTIDVTSVAVAQSQQPTLIVSQPALAFAPTPPGKPGFLILTIAQQHTDAPVTFTTDSPEHFQLASDNRPAFLPTLTLTPSSTGTHVHVRFFAKKNGLHTGQLTIRNRYEEKTVTLEGRSTGLLPTLHKPWPAIRPATVRRSTLKRLTLRRPTLRSPNRLSVSNRWPGLVALVLMGGLAYAGYTNRHRLLPAVYAAGETRQPVTQADGSLSAPLDADHVSGKETLYASTTKRATVQQAMTPLKGLSVRSTRTLSAAAPAKQGIPDRVASERRVQTDRRSATNPEETSKQNVDDQPERQTRRQVTPASPTEESELEQELNKKL